MTTTTRSKRKKTQPNSPGEDSPSVCPVCLNPIVDATVEKEDQEGIYCENICNSWIHRQCASLSQARYKFYEQGDDPFYCPHCQLTIQ